MAETSHGQTLSYQIQVRFGGDSGTCACRKLGAGGKDRRWGRVATFSTGARRKKGLELRACRQGLLRIQGAKHCRGSAVMAAGK